MTFTVSGTITRCPGQSHYHVPLTFGGGQTVTLHVDLSDLQFDPQEDVSVTRDLLIARLRSAGKEANASTFTQWRTALEGKTFKL